MRRTACLLLSGIIALHAEGSIDPPGAGAGPHAAWNEESCLKCHDAAAAAEIRGRVANPCDAMCATCHSFRERHHAVGVPISGRLPPGLVLTKKAANACVTCHDLTRSRCERSPWTSQSLFERVLRRSGENRTYFLAMRNDRGQLCRNCH